MWNTWSEYSRVFDPNKYDMIGGELVERKDYKKRMVEAEITGLESLKESLKGQLNILADRILTVEEKIKLKSKGLKDL